VVVKLLSTIVMNNLIVMSNVFDDYYFNATAIESIRHAAKRWGCNFFELNRFMFISNSISDSIHSNVASNRFWMMKTFKDFDRVLILDPDIVINSSAPNIFTELDGYDFAAVHNSNPSRNHSHFKNVNNFLSGIGIDIFHRYVPQFDLIEYYKYGFNGGVYLFNPQKISPMIDNMIELIETETEVSDILNSEWIFIQNLMNAFISSSDLKIKVLGDTWNWIAPDINFEWDLFQGPMHANIYHFTGTDLSKQSLLTFNKWK
jgi:lipopolysaccharide biosynthesis glycosyltransferase